MHALETVSKCTQKKTVWVLKVISGQIFRIYVVINGNIYSAEV